MTQAVETFSLDLWTGVDNAVDDYNNGLSVVSKLSKIKAFDLKLF